MDVEAQEIIKFAGRVDFRLQSSCLPDHRRRVHGRPPGAPKVGRLQKTAARVERPGGPLLLCCDRRVDRTADTGDIELVQVADDVTVTMRCRDVDGGACGDLPTGNEGGNFLDDALDRRDGCFQACPLRRTGQVVLHWFIAWRRQVRNRGVR